MADEGAQPGRGTQSGGAVGLHRHPDDADEGEGAGLLVARGRGDEGRPDPEAAEARDVEREHHEGDHDGVTVGATEAIACAVLALVQPGDEVVTFEPGGELLQVMGVNPLHGGRVDEIEEAS